MYTIYNVRYGDTLESVAAYFGTDTSTLKELNNFPKNYQMSIGDQIIVPALRNEMFMTYIVKAGDNLYDIARRYNVSVNDLLLLNGLNQTDYIYPNQEILIPKDNVKFYITKEGDTIESLLADNNILLEELASRNREIYLLPDQMIILNN